jgi:hypothetical protein
VGAIVTRNYRGRPGLAVGEPRCDLQRRLAEFPAIAVPAITLKDDANGASPHDPSAGPAL